MSKHTPGPWTHYDDSQDGKTNRHEIVAIGKTVARIYCSVPDQDRANARLIAKAPSMHALLSELADYLDVPESAAGGDDTARAYCKRIRKLLA